MIVLNTSVSLQEKSSKLKDGKIVIPAKGGEQSLCQRRGNDAQISNHKSLPTVYRHKFFQ